jgi:hypothetical protein
MNEKQLGQAMEMGIQILLSEQGYVSPVFVVDGYDEKGEIRNGVVQLQTTHDVKREELLADVVALAKQTTTLEPYLWKLDAVFYLEKILVDIGKHDLQSKQEVISIVCFDVPEQSALKLEGVKQPFSTKVFMSLKNQHGKSVGIRMIGYAEDFNIDTAVAQNALVTYAKTYTSYAPVDRQ